MNTVGIIIGILVIGAVGYFCFFRVDNTDHEEAAEDDKRRIEELEAEE